MTTETYTIRIYDIKWRGYGSKDFDTSFDVTESKDIFDEYTNKKGKIDFSQFVFDWVMHNGSKWGFTPKKWKFELI